MRRAASVLCVTVVLTLCPSLSLAQGPPIPPPPPPPMPIAPGRDAATVVTGTGRVAGRVTSLDTGRPIRRAIVRAGGPQLREGRSVSTDAEGRWEIRDLPAGPVSIMVTKGGYVPLQYGQRRPFEAGKTIDLATGQAIDKVDLALPRASVITGRVVDEFGDPVTDVRVNVMRYRFVGGQRRLLAMGNSDTTDDLGQYRVHGLAPGEYYLVAQPQSMNFLSVSGDRSGYAQTYFPNAYSPADATRVSLAVGQEASNLVIALAPTRFVMLSGSASNSEGQPVKAGTLRLMSPDNFNSPGTSAMIRPDGTWTMPGVVPGEYRLIAQSLRGSFEDVAATGSVSFTESAQMPITVGAEDITGIAVVTSKGGTIRGQVKWEGGVPPTPKSAASLGSVMASDTEFNTMGSSGAVIREDSTFEIRNVYGKRQLRAAGFPAGWHLKAITVNGQDVTDTIIEIPPGQDLSGVEIHATTVAGEISGTVQSAKGTRITDYVVVFFPPEADRWGWQSRFVRVARPDQTGNFKMSGLPEGSYFAVAVEYLESGEESNPEFLEKLKPLATHVTVGEGEKKTVTLKLAAQ
jgi:hypothetical protein